MGRHKKEKQEGNELPKMDNIEVFELPQKGILSIVLNRLIVGDQDVVVVEMASIIAGTRKAVTEFKLPHKDVKTFCERLLEFSENSNPPGVAFLNEDDATPEEKRDALELQGLMSKVSLDIK